jgi:hypothetical protein
VPNLFRPSRKVLVFASVWRTTDCALVYCLATLAAVQGEAAEQAKAAGAALVGDHALIEAV